MLGFGFEYDANFGTRKFAENSRENRWRGGVPGRRAEEITLIGVSKTHPASAIVEAYEAGVRHFGENRVQEWEGKHAGTEGLVATCI